MTEVNAPKVLTANDLDTGAVLFYGIDGDWVGSINEAAVVQTPAHESALMERAQSTLNRVIDTYFVALRTPIEHGCVPTEMRERHRLKGPLNGLANNPR
jgi:hypothetical protein